MISYDKIKELSTRSQTNEQNIRREYFQHLFLSNLFSQNSCADIFFKGGTALRLVYKSPRYSEDLDFSTHSMDSTKAEALVENTLLEIERIGVDTNIAESKLTPGGYLGIARFNAWGFEMGLKIEISVRDEHPTGMLTTLENDYIPSYAINVLDQTTVTFEKVSALLTRSKPRDFYDFYYLLRKNQLTSENKSSLTEIYRLTQSTKINFENELKLFLPKSHWKLIENFKAILLEELKRYI